REHPPHRDRERSRAYRQPLGVRGSRCKVQGGAPHLELCTLNLELHRRSRAMTESLPLFPLNTVLFPLMQLPLHIFEERYRLMIGRCLEENPPFGVALTGWGREAGAPAEPHPYGTSARIVDSHRYEDGRYRLLCRGDRRFRIESVTSTRPYIIGEVTFLDEETGEVPEAIQTEARTLGQEYLRILLKAPNRRQG